MRESVQHRYDRWLLADGMPPELRQELEQMRGDDEKIEDCFYREMDFGTGGLRGVLGAGTNRMNLYTVGKATQGLVHYLKRFVNGRASVAIAYDSRINSERFARYTASVLAANNLFVWVYPRLQPTPALSWAVRELRCDAGICITASHNPARYNGYKVYNADGCQVTLEVAESIQDEISRVDIFEGVRVLPFEDGLRQGRIRMIPEPVLNGFIDAACGQSAAAPSGTSLDIVYTPLNGAGRECVLRALDKMGNVRVAVVPEQEWPDGDFPTCPYPNPEIREALESGLELCRKLQPDILLATDPDCDRVGIAVAEGGEYVLLSGNETGILLLDFLCRSRMEKQELPRNAIAVTTIVSTDMADAVCAKYHVELRRTLTGFKFIGEQIGLLERAGEAHRFLFGFEESYGYLSGTHVRDKDAVNASVLICRMAAFYKERGITLVGALRALYEEFGWYHNELLSLTFSGADGMLAMQRIMAQLRTAPPKQIAGMDVKSVIDYMGGTAGLPNADVLEIRLEGNAKVLIRPSGTEPKIKLYCFAREGSLDLAVSACEKLSKGAAALLSGG